MPSLVLSLVVLWVKMKFLTCIEETDISLGVLFEAWRSKGRKMERNQFKIKDKRIIVRNIHEKDIPGRIS